MRVFKDAYKLAKSIPYIREQLNSYIEVIDNIGRILEKNLDNPMTLDIICAAKEGLIKANTAHEKIKEIYGET